MRVSSPVTTPFPEFHLILLVLSSSQILLVSNIACTILFVPFVLDFSTRSKDSDIPLNCRKGMWTVGITCVVVYTNLRSECQ